MIKKKSKKRKQKIEYSKILATSSLIMFILTLLFGYTAMVYLIITNQESILDLVFFTTASTLTGTIHMTTTKHYYSKSGLQNTTSIRNSVYEKIMEVRLQYIEEIIKLKLKYELTDEDFMEIEQDSPFVSISEEFLGGTTMKIDEVQTLNENEPEGEIY